MKLKIEIIVNRLYSLYIPAEGIDITLLRNEFNLLTNNTAENRPLSITQTFELPLEENRAIFNRLKGQPKVCQLLFNDVVVMTGALFEYSVDEQRKVVLVTITSAFKNMVDYMGDNILYMDKIDLSRWDYLVQEDFNSSQDNELLKFGYYNPMDTNTGAITFNQSNINAYCKPSLNLCFYFQEAFRINGWSANWDMWTGKMQKICLMPTSAYTCSSWCFKTSGTVIVPASSAVQMELSTETQQWNIVKLVTGIEYPGAEILPDNKVQCRQPNRLTSFKLKALYKCRDAFDFIIQEGVNEMAFIPSLGDEKVNYITDSVNLKEGLDPLSVVINNQNPYSIEIDFQELIFMNLFPIYETNQDDYMPPAGYMFPVAENYPKITPLEVYREIMTLFQMAQTSDDEVQEVNFYYINDIPNKGYTKIDVTPYLFWNGYEILSDKIEGLTKLNAIRYKEDKKRQRYFKVDIAPLPSNGVYFESLFAHAETNNGWGAAQIPSLKYKVKQVEEPIGDDQTVSISVEYLEFSEVSPQIGYYDNTADSAKIIFQPLHITTIVNEYWGNFLTFLSSFDGYNPVVYKLKLRISYYEYLQRFTQRNLFYYTSDCLLLDGEYDVLNQTFTGIFISLR